MHHTKHQVKYLMSNLFPKVKKKTWETNGKLENCVALQYKVRDLIKKGELSFEVTDEPNVNANPLPNHVGAK